MKKTEAPATPTLLPTAIRYTFEPQDDLTIAELAQMIKLGLLRTYTDLTTGFGVAGTEVDVLIIRVPVFEAMPVSRHFKRIA